MPLNGNKALDLDGLSHLVDTYIKNVKVQNNGTNLGTTLYLTHTNSGVTSDLSFTLDFLSGATTLTITGDNLSLPVQWFFEPSQGNNIVASKAYVDAKTWDASDIASGTLSAERIPTLNLSLKTSGTLSVARGGTGKTSFTAGRVLTSGTTSTGALQESAITTTELGYLDGVTSKIQTQLNGKANASHTHKADLDIYNIVSTNATAGSSTVMSPVYFSVGDSGTRFYIMAGRISVSGGATPRTVNVTLPVSVKHVYAPVVCESTGGGADGTQYYNAVRAGNGSGRGPGSGSITTFSIQMGIGENCYVSWMALADVR